jgi:iron-sulfur cluster repair protein YtfE (RIC family)
MRKLGVAGPVLLGVIATFAASRLLPPMIARTAGSVRAMAGDDPFDELMHDHQRIAVLLARMESEEAGRLGRQRLTLQLKHRLSAHAMAEENVVYPLIGEAAELTNARQQLYAEHARMKVLLHALEHRFDDQMGWQQSVAELRDLILGHIRQEEDVEFPRLRARLGEADLARLLSEVEREKAFLL